MRRATREKNGGRKSTTVRTAGAVKTTRTRYVFGQLIQQIFESLLPLVRGLWCCFSRGGLRLGRGGLRLRLGRCGFGFGLDFDRRLPRVRS
jgi:hypothetical protein